MFHIVLVSPEIPPNTGNVIRLSANTGCTLHLIKPLGFSLDDSHLRRAGLDYREYATLKTYESWDDFIEKEHPDPRDLYMFSSHATRSLPEVKSLPAPGLFSDVKALACRLNCRRITVSKRTGSASP